MCRGGCNTATSSRESCVCKDCRGRDHGNEYVYESYNTTYCSSWQVVKAQIKVVQILPPSLNPPKTSFQDKVIEQAKPIVTEIVKQGIIAGSNIILPGTGPIVAGGFAVIETVGTLGRLKEEYSAWKEDGGSAVKLAQDAGKALTDFVTSKPIDDYSSRAANFFEKGDAIKKLDKYPAIKEAVGNLVVRPIANYAMSSILGAGTKYVVGSAYNVVLQHA